MNSEHSELNTAINHALQYIGTDYAKASGKIRTVLRRADFDREVIEETVRFLIDHDYLDERAYCRRLLKRHSGVKQKSAALMRQLMREHGVSSDIIDEIADEIEDDAITIADYFALKYPHPEREDWLKMARHLAGRGYSEYLIRKILEPYR